MRRALLRLLEPRQYRRSDEANRICMEGMGGTLLDIGCGFFSDKFPFRSDVTYVGLDISDRARDVRADAHRLPLADASVDWVLLVGVLEHVDDPDRVLEEARRVLKPGGLGYVAVPFLQMDHAAQDYVRWTRQGFERLLSDHDFAIEQMVPNGGFFLVLDYLIWHRFRDAARRRSPMALVLLPAKAVSRLLAELARSAGCNQYATSFHARVRKP
jgi:SAM-dependent methyltransferase